MPLGHHPTILRAETTALLVVDVQPRLSRFIPRRDQVIATILRLGQLAAIFDLPVAITEQNNEKFGATEAPIREALRGLLVRSPVNKLEFSACASGECRALIREGLQRKQIVLTGMESHICILQTALDLIEEGRQVHVVADGIAARSKANHDIALRRMEQAGAIITNWESVVYEVAHQAGDEKFRRVLSEIMKAEITVPALIE